MRLIMTNNIKHFKSKFKEKPSKSKDQIELNKALITDLYNIIAELRNRIEKLEKRR